MHQRGIGARGEKPASQFRESETCKAKTNLYRSGGDGKRPVNERGVQLTYTREADVRKLCTLASPRSASHSGRLSDVTVNFL